MAHPLKKLSFRLPAFILLASLVPLACFGLYAINSNRVSLLAESSRATHRVADLAAELVEQQLNETLRDIKVAAQNLDLLGLENDDIEWALLSMLKQIDSLNELSLLDSNGLELMKVSIDHVYLPEDLVSRADDETFRKVLEDGQFFGDSEEHTQIDDTHLENVSHVGVSLIDPATQSIAAVLLADVNLRPVLQKITDIRNGISGFVYVIDSHDGRIIAHSDHGIVLKKLSLPIAQILGSGDPEENKDTFNYTNLSGEPVQGALVKVAGIEWLVVAERPLAGITKNLQETSRLLQLLLAGLLILLLPSVYYYINSIVRPLKQLEEGAAEIGAGQFGTVIPVSSDDEIGSVSASFNQMAGNLEQMTRDRDKLSWLKSGLNELAEILRGLETIEDIASQGVSQLAGYCNIPVAVLYVNDGNDRFQLAGGVAFNSTLPEKQEFAIGQGLVGEVARQRQLIELDDVPSGYLDITSGLGSTDSEHLLLLPLIHNDEVLGVLEVGSLKPFSEDVKLLFDQASLAMAIAISLALSRKSISEALIKSQRFSEELQAQQEELQAANEELEEKTKRLQASEEELQSQHEELQAANEELEEKSQALEDQQEGLKEKNRLLDETRKRLEQHAHELQVANRYKSEFLANMSHELRTPLNSLLILSQDLAANTEENLTTEQVESAEVIYNSGNDLLNLINEILDLSKIEAGKMELNVEPVNLEEYRQRLVKNFTHMAKSKNLELQVNMIDNAPEILETDLQRLDQVVRNLIANAIKFTDEGSITVEIGVPPSDIIFVQPGLDVANSCAITVSDTGIGIPADRLEDIFGAFQQIDGSLSRQFSGTGLGLTISKELTALLGGELRVESQPGEGSTFTLVLPLNHKGEQDEKTVVTPDSLTPEKRPAFSQKSEDPNEPVAPTIKDDREKLQADDRVILIVEDDLSFAKILAKICTEKGFCYLHSGDGKSALKLIEQYMPMAVLLDINLPRMHGLELLDIIKGRSDLRHIPVHVISALDSSHDALRLGAVGFLSKPSSREELEQVLIRVADVASGKTRKLLIVEDDDTQRQSIVKLIGNGDVESLQAATGEEALTYIQSGVVDCMILDLNLPDMSGFQLLQQMEEDLDISPPPVIIYTGRDLSREEEDTLNEYSASIIVKGVRSSERLLDEASLFLHRVVAKLPNHKQAMIASLSDGENQFEGRKILLVDDDMRNVFSLAKVLEKKGLTVLKAANGQKALEVLDTEPDIDLVLMDIMMPVMDGYEAMRRIREQDRFSRLPVLALTAKAMQEDRNNCIEAGANDYLSKPIDIAKLLSLVRVWLQRK